MPKKSALARGSIALLGLDHPHAPLILRSLQNLRQVKRVHLWAENGAALRSAQGWDRRKVMGIGSDLTALLRDHPIEAAILCARTADVAGIAARVLKAGIPLLVDKPAGITAKEVSALSALARRRKIIASVYYAQRTHPAAKKIRALIAADTIGQVLTVETRMHTTQVRYRNPRHWLFSRRVAGGGVLSWLVCHHLDLLRFLLGDEIVSLSAQIATRTARIDVEDVAALALRFRSGAIGTSNSGYVLANAGAGYANLAGYDNRVGITGTRGRLIWSGTTEPTLRVEALAKSGKAIARIHRFRLRKTDSYGGAIGEDFLVQFLAAVRGAAPNPCSLDEAAIVSRALDAAYRSARSGRAEPIRR